MTTRLLSNDIARIGSAATRNPGPPDAEPASDCRRPEFLVTAQPQDFAGVDRWLAALIDATRLGGALGRKLRPTRLVPIFERSGEGWYFTASR